MNLKAEYMINRLFIAAVILSLLPAATAFGQELREADRDQPWQSWQQLRRILLLRYV